MYGLDWQTLLRNDIPPETERADFFAVGSAEFMIEGRRHAVEFMYDKTKNRIVRRIERDNSYTWASAVLPESVGYTFTKNERDYFETMSKKHRDQRDAANELARGRA